MGLSSEMAIAGGRIEFFCDHSLLGEILPK